VHHMTDNVFWCSYEEEENGVILRFTNQAGRSVASYRAKVLIGADGARSFLRQQSHGDDDQLFHSVSACRRILYAAGAVSQLAATRRSLADSALAASKAVLMLSCGEASC
jgi:2-polyprenyl-6-methoxyphenol hydroxylase-like FAD-dependent oxidoreductase